MRSLKNLAKRRATAAILVLLTTSLTSRLFGQELTIYAIPPAASLNWHSPQRLFISYAINLFGSTKYKKRRHAMGHVVIELKNGDYYALAGMIPKSKAEMYFRVAVKGSGLGVMFQEIPGRLEEGPGLYNEINNRCQNGDVAWLKFKLADTAFSRLRQYLEEYKAKGYDKIYNGANRPREGKGAGCSAFAVSFIELAGLMKQDEMQEWLVRRTIPETLIGHEDNSIRELVPPARILFTTRWADTSRKSFQSIIFYEPGFMYNWIIKEWNKNASTPTVSYSKALRGKSHGILKDCTKYPVPGEPIWKDSITTTKGTFIAASEQSSPAAVLK